VCAVPAENAALFLPASWPPVARGGAFGRARRRPAAGTARSDRLEKGSDRRIFPLDPRSLFVSVGARITTEQRRSRRNHDMAAKKTDAKKSGAKATAMSKSQLINAIVEASADAEVTRKQVKAVLESLVDVGHKELKKSGLFTVPGFAKFRVIKKPATKARQGINPFTKEPMTFAAKPASKSVRARPVKLVKDAVS
jgi:nucleoid DNA-binding protein